MKYDFSSLEKKALKDPLSVNRIEACFRLMNFENLDAVKIISKVMFEDRCELVRHEAAFCLGEMNFDLARENLKISLEKDESLVVKHECLVSLGTIGVLEKDEKVFKKYLNDENEIIRASAIVGFERLNQKDFFEKEKNESVFEYQNRLVNLLKNKRLKRNDIIQIMFRLLTIENEISINAIFNILKTHSCPIVRHEAAFSLGEIRDELAVKKLIEALSFEKNSVVLHEILFALGTTNSKLAIESLKKYLDFEEYIVSESAKIALDRIEKLKNPYKGTEEFENLNKIY